METAPIEDLPILVSEDGHLYWVDWVGDRRARWVCRVPQVTIVGIIRNIDGRIDYCPIIKSTLARSDSIDVTWI
jgi:hypothetical protein